MTAHDLLMLLLVFVFAGVAWLWSLWDFCRHPCRPFLVHRYPPADHPSEALPVPTWDLRTLVRDYSPEGTPPQTSAGGREG
jgi:hypothetical protein